MRAVLLPTIHLIMLAAILQSPVSAGSNTLSDQQWAGDLRQLSASVKELHFKPFHVISEAEFDAAVAALDAQIPQLSDKDIVIEMARIMALLRDGHSRLHIPRLYPELALQAELGHSGTKPPHFDSLRFRQSPVRFGLFDDGLFVVAATPKHRKLIGRQVVSIDDTPIEKAIEATRHVSFFENDWRAKLMAPDRLALPEVTTNLEISNNADMVVVTTRDAEGRIQTSQLQTLSRSGQAFVSGIDISPLWLRKTSHYRWYEVLPDRDAIYVQINEFEENPVTPYGDFVAETIAAARDASVSRYVIDLRHNYGGIGAWVTPFVTGLINSEFNEHGRLYILTGRTTFSAAQFMLHRFEEYSHALFVGEPSGAKPSHFGDARRITLDNSGLTLRISTIYWHSWLANDFRDAIRPHITAPLTSSAVFDGYDPVLEAALGYFSPPGLAARMDEQFRQQKNQNALLLYQRYMTDARFGNHKEAVPGLISMANKLAEDGFIRPAYFVHFIVNSSFPGDPQIESDLARLKALME
ncbi:MAG: hypothetical protein HKN49_03175 [Gammaproteobacteria bacterium]|nr:hypothetical protein [Gammaproteobacteria bacterium]